MIADVLQLSRYLLEYCLLLTFQLALVLALRNKISRWFGANLGYCLWLLPILWIPFAVVDSAVDWQLILRLAGAASSSYPESLVDQAVKSLPFNLQFPEWTILSLPQAARISLWTLFLAAWFAGGVFLLVHQGLRVRQLGRHLRSRAVLVHDDKASRIRAQSGIGKNVPLYYLDGVNGPALFGMLKPALLLPPDFLNFYDADQRHIMLSHEAVHLWRKDALWNLCAWFIKTLFWFNPLMHVSYRYFRLDQELSCDALALKNCNAAQRKRYARTLLESFTRTSIIHHSPVLTAWNNLRDIKERTTMIKQPIHSKSRLLEGRTTLLAVLLAGAAMTVTLSDQFIQPAFAAEAQNAETTAAGLRIIGVDQLAGQPIELRPVFNDYSGGRPELWVHTRFTASAGGDVLEPQIVDTNNKGAVPDEDMLSSISRFKFHPHMENGQAIAVPGMEAVFRFSLVAATD